MNTNTYINRKTLLALGLGLILFSLSLNVWRTAASQQTTTAVALNPLHAGLSRNSAYFPPGAPGAIFATGDINFGGRRNGSQFEVGVAGTSPNDNNWPSDEAPPNALDRTSAKYLNFAKLNTGIIVNPALNCSVATSLQIWTANDFPDRDPASYELYGSNSTISGSGPFSMALFTLISSGSLSLPAGRNDGSLNDANSQTVTFSNTTAYRSYLLLFPTVKNPSGTDANSMQIGEVQLFGNPNTCSTCPTITVIPPAVSNATVGQPFSATFTQTGGTAPVTFSVAGSPPPPPPPVPSASAATLTVNIASITVNSPGSVEAIVALGGLAGTALVTQFNTSTKSFGVVLAQSGNLIGAFTLPAGPHLPAYAGGALNMVLALNSTGFRLTSGAFDSGQVLYTAAGVANFNSFDDLGPTAGFVIGASADGSGADITATVNFDSVKLESGSTPPLQQLYFTDFTGNSGSVPTGWTDIGFDTAPQSTVIEGGTVVAVSDFRPNMGDSGGPQLIQSAFTFMPVLPAPLSPLSQLSSKRAASLALVDPLPPGLTLSPAGILSGTPTQAGSFTFTVKATDANGCTGMANYTLQVVRMNGSLGDPLACTGPGGLLTGTIEISNPAASAQAFTLTTTFTNYAGIPGSCVLTGAAAGATCTVTAGGLTASGNILANTTLTVTYQAQVATVPAGTVLTASNVATLGGATLLPNPLVFSTTVNCPAPGPGQVIPSTSEMSDQKAGSVLIYNTFTSGATSGNTQNTRINITNTHPTLPAFVHLFFVAEGCSVADSYLCLTANQTASFLASDLDPGTSGYLVAVAVDGVRGCPTNFNYLIGDEYVKFTTGHAANLGAQAFSAIAGGLPACDGNSVTAQLNFDGTSYNRLPATLALSNIGSRADGNDTLLIVNRIGGNLGIGASTLGTLFGILYDDAENALSFSVAGNCQLRNSITNNFPRTTPRFETFIPAGRTGWLKIFNQTGAAGITGAAINFNANAASSAGAFNQGHNLHGLTLNATNSYTIPVFPPSC